jgi:hypothetical protein
MNLVGTGLEALGVFVVLAQALLYGLPGDDGKADSTGRRLEGWLQSADGRETFAKRLILIGFVGTSIFGLIALAADRGLFDLRRDVAIAMLVVQFALYPLVFLTAAPVLKFTGQHLRALLGLSGTVLGLGVVLQFLALIS